MRAAGRVRHVVRTTSNLGRALALVWESSGGWTIANGLLLVLQGVLPVVSLYLLKLLVDAVAEYAVGPQAGQGMPAGLLAVLAAAGGVAVLGGIAGNYGQVAGREQGRRVADHMQGIVQRKATEVDLAYYENTTLQDSLHRAQEESEFRPAEIVNALSAVVQNTVSLAGVVWLLVTFHWVLFPVLVVALVPTLLVRLSFSRQEYLLEREYTERERRADYYHWILSGRELAKEVRLSGLGPTLMDRFRRLREWLRRTRLGLDLRNARAASIAHVASTVLVFGAYLWVARDAVLGRVTVGAFVLFYQAFQRGQTFLGGFLGGVADLYENNLFLENLYEFLDVSPVIESGAAVHDPSPRTPGASGPAEVVFEDVWFRYPGTGTDVLKGVDFRLREGSVTALVGVNGAGKTTLVKLLCRLYDPDRGSVTIGGRDIRSLHPTELRERIAIVFQDYPQYNLPARDNIWFGDVRREPDEGRIARASRRAGIHEMIDGLESGYDTVLGRMFEDGHELSTGEWQRVALARAFFREAGLVVLDEPTSSMDPRAEHDFYNAFGDIVGGRTALLISHRMATVRMADVIYVLVDGRIAEAGSHQTLMEADGLYAELFRRQASRYL